MRKLCINIATACIPIRTWRKKIRKKLLASSPVTRGEFAEFIAKEIKEMSQKTDLIMYALHDANGLAYFQLLLESVCKKEEFYPILYEIKKDDVCIDCGMHAGKFTDIILLRGGISYGFEANPFIFSFLLSKYENNPHVTCINKAVSNLSGKRMFFLTQSVDSQGASMNRIADYPIAGTCEVGCVRLVDYLKDEVLVRHERIRILKLDVEGEEFQIIPDIIESRIHEKIDYILCETHERYIENGEEMLENLKNRIQKEKIENINLNWI